MVHGTAMKAIVQHRYGPPDILELRAIEEPVLGQSDVLIRVHGGAVNPGDWFFLRGEPYVVVRLVAGLRNPKNAVKSRHHGVTGQPRRKSRTRVHLHPGYAA
jgi:hypothetical protein